MAEIFSTVVAGAQVIDYCKQIYDVFRKVYNAADNQKKYDATSEQLIDIIQQIEACPYLRTPGIIRCTKNVLDKLIDAHTTLSRPRKNIWTSSVAFAFKQKQYDQLFADLEHQREIMSLHIVYINTNTMGQMTATLDTIKDKVGDMTKYTTEGQETVSRAQIDSFSVEEPSEYLPRREPAERQITTDDSRVVSHFGICETVDQCPVTEQRPWLGPSRSLLSMMQEEAMEEPACIKQQPIETDGVEKKEDQFRSRLEGNIQRADDIQILGLDVCSGATIADADILRISSSLCIRNNIHAGKGTQVIGQRVRSGATAHPLAGEFCNNEHQGHGSQVVGLLLS
ncbi:uncharacterized protein PG998_004335 [Apiospora kogelbergensis]|uniref:uncharacterized protein n=1 Tax=Apiospora kogelbergensis TaxID=1337665 RepID=UPI003131E737